MKLTITASSSALFSTWIFVEELGIVFDAGDGLCASLQQKSRKIRHAFITHADRDHLAGLLQFHQLNAGDGKPTIHYPADCGSFPALKDFMERFDPQCGPATWNPMRAEDEIDIDASHRVCALPSDHVETSDEAAKAFRFVVEHRRRTLRTEHRGLEGAEIARLRSEKGEDAVTEEQRENILGYSGDAACLDPTAWKGVKILFHECTFLEANTAKRAHSHIDQVLEAAASMDLEALVLFHFSTRYPRDQIVDAIRQKSASAGIAFPVYAVLPGEVVRDLLALPPIWSGQALE